MVHCSFLRFLGCFLAIAIWFLGACSSDERKADIFAASEDLKPRYARGFDIQKSDGVTLLSVTRPWMGASRPYYYALLEPGSKLPDNFQADAVIEKPITRLVVTSTSHIPFLDLLKVSHYLVGFPQTRFISSEAVRERVDQHMVWELGAAGGLNFEALIALQPQLVMTYQSGPDHRELENLSLTGIPTVLNSDFLEETPLGRAEWIKFVGHLVGKGELADSIFSGIEATYLQNKARLQDLADKPTVFSGSLYGDTWFAPGGESFVSQFIRDAGGAYTWDDLGQTGSLELSFESVLERNIDSEYWIGLGGFTSLQELKKADPRYSVFEAFQKGNVYNYHGKIGATGGFEYLESGGARPDRVLCDFIKILHPAYLPEHQLYFFKKLE